MRSGADSFTLKFKYKALLADEDCHRAMRAVKGSSGWKACLTCKNILGRTGAYNDFVTDGYLLHLVSPEHDKFDLHTSESFDEMIDRLKVLAVAGNKTRLAEEEKS